MSHGIENNPDGAAEQLRREAHERKAVAGSGGTDATASGTSDQAAPNRFRIGNALADGGEHRAWFLGGFFDADDARHSRDVEAKWARHPAGDCRTESAEATTTTTLTVLLTGHFVVHFAGGDAELGEPGDYALFGPEFAHSWEAVEDSTMLTIRWVEGQKAGAS